MFTSLKEPLNQQTVTAHLKLKADRDFSHIIVCGAPERAEWFSQRLQSAQLIAKNREYYSFYGTWKGRSVAIISHGVGAPGAAIAFKELIQLGAKKIIRIGTAGGIQENLGQGDIVLAQAAVREEGTTSQMVPSMFPATADLSMTCLIQRKMEERGWKGRPGIILTRDLFYSELLDVNYEQWRRAGVQAVEMEASALFVLGSLYNVQTAAVFVLDGNVLRWNQGDYNPDPRALENSMIKVFESALDALTEPEDER